MAGGRKAIYISAVFWGSFWLGDDDDVITIEEDAKFKVKYKQKQMNSMVFQEKRITQSRHFG